MVYRHFGSTVILWLQNTGNATVDSIIINGSTIVNAACGKVTAFFFPHLTITSSFCCSHDRSYAVINDLFDYYCNNNKTVAVYANKTENVSTNNTCISNKEIMTRKYYNIKYCISDNLLHFIDLRAPRYYLVSWYFS